MGALDDSPRGRVLRAAAHLFATQGYERTTVRDLARMVGIQSGSLFHHFDSKLDILSAVMEEAIHYNHQRMRQALALATDRHARLFALVRSELEAICGPSGEAMKVLVYEWESLPTPQQQALLALRQAYEQDWLTVLQEMQAAGELIYEPFLWRRLLAGAIAWTHSWYHPQGRLGLEELTTMVVAMARAGQLPAPSINAPASQDGRHCPD